jgi:hypothetical protein
MLNSYRDGVCGSDSPRGVVSLIGDGRYAEKARFRGSSTAFED